ncbi:MAG: hypothetical protein ACJ8C4_02560 [Gemmataceae bacterium]
MMPRLVLRDLPCSARVTIAVFLLAVGLGYVSALVQLHQQHASPGQILPEPEDAVRIFHGTPGRTSRLQGLLEADESLPMTGSGSMAAAFTKRSGDWRDKLRAKAKEMQGDSAAAETALRKERDGERLVMLAFAGAGAPRVDYDADRFTIPADLRSHAITGEYRDGDSAKIKTLFTDRCVRCHAKDGDDEKAANYPLDTIEQIQKYAKVEAGSDRMSLTKLAQSTHAHLLSFAVLFGFTGLLFALTDYPGLLRFLLAPSVLLVQVVDIACWWLARIDGPQGEMFAKVIPITGAIVGAGLALQIVLTLLHLFGAFGRLVLLALFAAAAYAGYVAREKVVDPFLKQQAGQIKVQA